MDLSTLSAVFSALHLLALAVGLPSIFLRGRALSGPLNKVGLNRLFGADTGWGVAAVLWISTGLYRAFGGLEKGTEFYLTSPLFMAKMGLLAAVLLLEVWPMVTFIRWRVVLARGGQPDMGKTRALYAVNQLQLALIVTMVFVAAFMARGFGIAWFAFST